MKLFLFVVSLAFNCEFSQTLHKFRLVIGCFYNGTAEVTYDFDGDLGVFADFQNNKLVVTVPPFIYFDLSPYPDLFNETVGLAKTCLSFIGLAEIFLKDIAEPEAQDPPESMLYPADEDRKGVENSLVCFVNRFYPPHIKVTWTKNNRPVSEGVSISSNLPNKDQTFHCFSTLTFTPEQGDVYSCTVEHSALDAPKTRIWEVELKITQNLALDLYCGGGLTVAFIGVAVGTFLVAKGRYGH